MTIENVPSVGDGNQDKPHLFCRCVFQKSAPFTMACGAQIEDLKFLPEDKRKWCNRCAEMDEHRPVIGPCGHTIRK